MEKIINFPDQTGIKEQASNWLIRLDSGEMSEAEAQLFRAWLDESREHRNALIDLAMLWDNMEILSELSELFPLVDRCSRKGKIFTGIRERFVFTKIIGAATVAVLVLGIYLYQHTRGNGVPPAPGETAPLVYQTALGEQLNVVLPDGSRAILNTSSKIEVVFNERQRNLRLVRGQAHFEVRRNPERPFIVFAGKGIVQAVGTAFSVYLKGADVEVTVTEGRVEIAAPANTSSDTFIDVRKMEPGNFRTTITAGQCVEYDHDQIQSVRMIDPETLARKLSWQHGMLEFKGEPLQQVVDEISRYTSTKIIISDPTIRKIRVGGYFKAGETEALLDMLEGNFFIKVDRVKQDLIYLSSADSSMSPN